MDCSTPGFPILHHLPEFAQTHVHWVGDAIPPSHPLLSPSPPALSFSQHQGLFPMSQFFASGGQSTGASASASVLPMNTQGWFSLGWTGWISLLSKGSADMFMSKTLRWEGYPGLPRWTLNEITRILRRGRKRRREIWHRGDDVTTEAENGATWPQAKGCSQPPEAGRGEGWWILPWGVQEEHSLTNTLVLAQWYWFWTSGLQKCERINFCVF